jgi:hypothetical protein
MTIFGILAGVFVYRYTKANKGNPRPVSEKEDDPWIFCYAIGVAYITVLIRCVYRYSENTYETDSANVCLGYLRWQVDGVPL